MAFGTRLGRVGLRGLVAACLLASCASHTVFLSPTPRESVVHVNQELEECGAQTTIAATYTRGQVVPLSWGRNNHQGGFVQVSVLPLAQTQGNGKAQVDAFDDPQNVVYMSCYNRGCFAGGNPTGGDMFGIGPDGTDFQQNVCSAQMTMPSYLADGDYVMKMVVFGNGAGHKLRNMPHSSYSNCHNFRVAGGAALVPRPAGVAGITFDLQDDGIGVTNAKTGSAYPAFGQCMFLGSNSHLGCRGDGSRDKSALCQNAVAAVSRCDSATADSRAECLGPEGDGTSLGEPLYNFMIGKPALHPDNTGQYILLSHTRDNRPVVAQQDDVGGGGSGKVGQPNPKALYFFWPVLGALVLLSSMFVYHRRKAWPPEQRPPIASMAFLRGPMQQQQQGQQLPGGGWNQPQPMASYAPR